MAYRIGTLRNCRGTKAVRKSVQKEAERLKSIFGSPSVKDILHWGGSFKSSVTDSSESGGKSLAPKSLGPEIITSEVEPETELSKEELKLKYELVRRMIDSIAEDYTLKLVETSAKNSDGFSAPKKPKMSLNDYLFRLVKYMDKYFKYDLDRPEQNAGTRALLFATIYINRIQKMAELELHIFNIFRLFMSCMLVAAKFTEDKPISHAYWAKVAGCKIADLNVIEMRLVASSDFNLFVEEDEFVQTRAKYLTVHEV